MLLHHYLQLKSAILTKAKAEIDNLEKEITDPAMHEAFEDWELGDPITDEYAQEDQTALGEIIHTDADAVLQASKTLADQANQTIIQPAVAAGAQDHQPQGQTTQQEPAGGNAPE